MTVDQLATYRAALREARQTFQKATARLSELKVEESRLTDEITRLRRTVSALAAMCSESPAVDTLGITESVTEVMSEALGSMTTRDVVVELDGMGFDLASQKNASASVHSVLSRLERKGLIKRVETEAKDVKWRGPKFDPDYDEIPF